MADTLKTTGYPDAEQVKDRRGITASPVCVLLF
jgi:hypothetical protein